MTTQLERRIARLEQQNRPADWSDCSDDDLRHFLDLSGRSEREDLSAAEQAELATMGSGVPATPVLGHLSDEELREIIDDVRSLRRGGCAILCPK